MCKIMKGKDQIKEAFKKMGRVSLLASILGGITCIVGVPILYILGIIPSQIFAGVYLYLTLIFGVIVGICGGYVYFYASLIQIPHHYLFYSVGGIIIILLGLILKYPRGYLKEHLKRFAISILLCTGLQVCPV